MQLWLVDASNFLDCLWLLISFMFTNTFLVCLEEVMSRMYYFEHIRVPGIVCLNECSTISHIDFIGFP